MPANTALLGQLVPRKLLTGAATWNSTTWQVGAVTGPALGGLVYGFLGVIPALLLIFSFIYSVQSCYSSSQALEKLKFSREALKEYLPV